MIATTWPIERQVPIPKTTHWHCKNILTGLTNLTNWVFCLPFKKTLENHHPEKEYFIHASLANDRKMFSTQNGMKKKKKMVSMNFQRHLENWQKN